MSEHRYELAGDSAPYNPNTTNTTYSNLEVSPQYDTDTNKQAINPNIPDKEAYTLVPDAGVVNDKNDGVAAKKARRRICGLSILTFAIIVGIILLVIIGAVVGGVVGSQQNKSKSTSSSSGGSSTPTATATGSGSTATATLYADTKLAAVAYNDSNSNLNYRVFYQDEDNYIRASGYNDSDGWVVTDTKIVQALPGSALALASTGPPNFNPQVNLFYLDNSSQIRELITYDYETWTTGSIDSQAITVNPNSSLTAVWHESPICNGCPDTLLLVYQDTNSSMRLANMTSDGVWDIYTLPGTPIVDTGLSITLRYYSTYVTQLRIYYQIETGDMGSLWWSDPVLWSNQNFSSDPSMWPDARGWQDREGVAVLTPMPTSSPPPQIAAFIYGFTSSASNPSSPEYMDFLSTHTSFTGLNVTWWRASDGAFPPVQAPNVFEGIVPGSPLGVTSALGAGAGKVFALQESDGKKEIAVFEMEGDGVTWEGGALDGTVGVKRRDGLEPDCGSCED